MGRRPRGPLPAWKPRTARQKAILADLIARYEQHYDEGTLDRGGRGMFYDLRPNGMGNGATYRKPDSDHPIKPRPGVPGFGPMEVHPGAVQEVLVLARRAGIIDEDWVADTRAPAAMGTSYDRSAEATADLIAGMVEDAREHFKLNPQRFQPVWIEVLCEAEDLQPRLSRVAGRAGVLVYSGAGFDGLKGKLEFADRALARDVPTAVLQVGDLDLDGENIYNAADEDAIAWAEAGTDGDCPLRFQRLALTVEQATEPDLLDEDGKAEVDGLPVPVMNTILAAAIEALQDPAGRAPAREM
jgi:hypothetical protein